jgi:hypothetical protein
VSPCCILDDYDVWLWNINDNSLTAILCSKLYEDFLNNDIREISTICLSCKINNNDEI